MKPHTLAALLVASAVAFTSAQTDKLDYAMLGRIRDEGLNRIAGDGSHLVAERRLRSAAHRLARHPAGERVGDEEVRASGASPTCTRSAGRSARAGRSCASRAHLVEPQVQPLIGFPQEWSSGTKGPVTADVVRVQIANEADFAKYRGKLAGKIVLTQPARARADARRADHPAHGPTRRSPRPRRRRCRRQRRRAARGDQARRRSAQKARDVLRGRRASSRSFDRGSDSDMAAGGSDLSWQQQHPDGGTIFPTGSERARRQRRHRACRRSRSRSSTTTAWCACSTRACR